MAKKLFILIVAAFYAFSICANDKISLQSRLKLNIYNNKTLLDASQPKRSILPYHIQNGINYANVIISITEGHTLSNEIIDELRLNIFNEFGTFVIASLPIENIDKLSQCDCIEYIELEQEVSILNDSARVATKINPVHLGSNLPQSFKGKDVIVGVIDCGIDFNHINFKDKSGKSRLKKAGIYNTTTRALEIYTDEIAISELTSDATNESHGTHVAGIAAGSYTQNGLYGMAPESDLILFGLGAELTNVNILRGINTIFNYANSVNKPAVINISLGTNKGPHDGYSSFNRSIKALEKEGNVIVFAVGNEGNSNICINKTFLEESTSTPQMATTLYSDKTTYLCEIDAWSRDKNIFGIQYFIYDIYSKKEVISSDVFYPATTNYNEHIWNATDLSQYFSGRIATAGQLYSANKRYELYTLIDGTLKDSKYRIGIKYYGKQNTIIDCWANNVEFSNHNNSKYIAGTPYGSYSDMACGNNTISIGAYSSRTKFKNTEGATYSVVGAELNYIADFSSYGIDITERNHPDVTAPGHTVISSVNGFDYNRVNYNHKYIASEVKPFGSNRSYHWGHMSGTSMACPVATGTVALWLQANPYLTTEDVRKIMIETATNDIYTSKGTSSQWGAGKLNAFEGIVKALQMNGSAIKSVENDNNIFIVKSNGRNGKFSFYFHNENTAEIFVYSTNGSMVYNSKVVTDNGNATIQFNSTIPSGLYIVKVIGKNSTHSTRLFINN